MNINNFGDLILKMNSILIPIKTELEKVSLQNERHPKPLCTDRSEGV